MKPSTKLLKFLACSAFLASASTGFAVTRTWSGTTSSDYATGSNWGGTAPLSGTTVGDRLNIYTGTRPMIYATAQGTTIYNPNDRVLGIGGTNGVTATVEISGGVFDSRTTNTSANSDFIGTGGGIGILNIIGGTYTNVNGGNANRLNVGLNALSAGQNTVATVNVSAGSLISGTITFGNHAGDAGAGTVTSTINLTGSGILETGGFTRESSTAPANLANITSNIRFDGGTLRARGANNANFMADAAISGTALVKVGGVKIDSNTFNIGISQALTEDSGSTGGGLIKQGTGTLTLSGVNTYTGATSITGGTLALSGTGSIANSSTITINSSTSLSITGLTGNFTVGANQSLGGSGTITAASGKTVFANGTLTPGNSPGTLSQDGGTLQLGIGGDLNWQVYNANGVAGTGYDTVSLINGAVLDLSALSAGNTYNINLWSLSGIGPDANGNAINFNNALNYAWTLFSTDSAIAGFNTSKFTIHTGSFNGTNGFTNTLNGTFDVALADGGTDLVLTYTAIPEPGAALLGGLGLLALLRRRR